ncbi:MAG: phosphoribosylformylglycinamidine synthase subunit PurS [Fimbriimonadaceae bacterium]|nr:MAG: phosphoribosylformylglycinamidine synthase subunit PurS [Fimbriimonadaceae bacterium]
MVKVRVTVMLKQGLLDSAGRTVLGSLRKLGYPEVEEVKIGKVVDLQMPEFDEAKVKAMCDRLLANPVIEDYRYEVLA